MTFDPMRTGFRDSNHQEPKVVNRFYCCSFRNGQGYRSIPTNAAASFVDAVSAQIAAEGPHTTYIDPITRL